MLRRLEGLWLLQLEASATVNGCRDPDNQEPFMSDSQYPEPVTDHLLFSLQCAVWAAVLACIVLAVDTPQLAATPAQTSVSTTAPAANVAAPAAPAVDHAQ